MNKLQFNKHMETVGKEHFFKEWFEMENALREKRHKYEEVQEERIIENERIEALILSV